MRVFARLFFLASHTWHCDDDEKVMKENNLLVLAGARGEERKVGRSAQTADQLTLEQDGLWVRSGGGGIYLKVGSRQKPKS